MKTTFLRTTAVLLLPFILTGCIGMFHEQSIPVTENNSIVQEEISDYEIIGSQPEYSTEAPLEDSESEEQTIALDVVSPIQNYFVWYGGNGYGYLDTKKILGKEAYTVEFSIDDLYFMPTFEGVIRVVRENEEIAIISFTVISDGNLKKDDNVRIHPYVVSGSLKGYTLLDKELSVPDLGEYITKDALINEDVINLFKDYTYESYSAEKQLYALYTLELKPGYTHGYPVPKCSDRMFVIVFSDTDGQNYSVFTLYDVYVRNAKVEVGGVVMMYSNDWNNTKFKKFEDFEEKMNETYSKSYKIEIVYHKNEK